MVATPRHPDSAAHTAPRLSWALAPAMILASCTANLPASDPGDFTGRHIDRAPALTTLEPRPREPLPDEAAGENPPTALTEQQQRQLLIFGQTVLNPSNDIDADTRRNAAHELVAMNVPESIAVLAEALESQRPAVMLAAIAAMQAVKAPMPQLLQPAVAALSTAPPTVLESLSWAIARYGEDALHLVAELALDQNAASGSRLGPIQTLSAFDSQRAAASLMSLIVSQSEPTEIVAAACDGLQQLSGLSFGADVQQWHAWWKEAGSLPPERWSAHITKSLSKRAAQFQLDLQKQREANNQVARALSDAYRDLYPALPTPEQLRRLPSRLENQFAPVRDFAISRISQLLRDRVRIPHEIQQRLVERLADEVPALRIEAAKVLDELNDEAIGPAIAARLAMEESAPVAAVLLDVAGRRPCPQALDPARRWMGDPNLADQSAATLVRVLETATFTPDQVTALRDDVRRAAEHNASPGLIRLLAWIGDDTDAAQLAPLLDGHSDEIRAAVADGFFRRGLQEPLADRASDPVIFPFAVRVVSGGTANIAAFRLLVSWEPAEASRNLWQDAVASVAQRMSPADLLACDDILAATPHAAAEQRTAVLMRAATLKKNEITDGLRTTALTRLVALLIAQGEAGQAFSLIEDLDVHTPELKAAGFQASVLSGHYDKAIQLQPEAEGWIALLAETAQRDAKAGNALREEIARRFDGRLSPQDQARFEHIVQTLSSAPAAPSP